MSAIEKIKKELVRVGLAWERSPEFPDPPFFSGFSAEKDSCGAIRVFEGTGIDFFFEEKVLLATLASLPDCPWTREETPAAIGNFEKLASAGYLDL